VQVVLRDTTIGERMDQSVDLLKALLSQKQDAEQTWLVYR